MIFFEEVHPIQIEKFYAFPLKLYFRLPSPRIGREAGGEGLLPTYQVIPIG